MDEPRESIWSVPSSLKAVYYSMFTVLALLSAVLVLVEVLSTEVPGSIVDKTLGFGERLAPMAVASAALSMVAMEVVGLVGIIGSYLERRLDEHFEKRAERARARQERARAREERARAREERARAEAVAEARAEAVAEARAEARAQGRAEERAKWEERERRIAEDGARIPPPPPADEDNGA